jgi:cell division protein FtsB
MPQAVVTPLRSPRPGSPQPRSADGGADTPAPLRRRKAAPVAGAASSFALLRTRLLNYVLGFVTIVLVVDALVGDKGLLDIMRARRQHAALAAAIAQTRRENARLRDDIRRLREDPGAIESLARQELGLMRDGEVLFIVKDTASPNR